MKCLTCGKNFPYQETKDGIYYCSIKCLPKNVSIDNVNHPPHYTTGKIEVLDFILDQKMNYMQGNCIKYLSRYPYKNGLQDLEKARFYLNKLIETYGESGK